MTASLRNCAVAFALLGVFSVTSSVFAAQSIWDGGGQGNNFSSAQNWVGDVAPLPNDIIVFDGAFRPTPNNDYPAGTQFNGITFASTVAFPFTVTGNSVNLNGDILDNTQAFANTISFPLALQVTPTVFIAPTGSLSITSNISGSGFGLNETGSGTLTLSGTNTFTGNVTVGSGATLSIATDANLGTGAGASALTLTGGSTLLVQNSSLPNQTTTTTLSATRGVLLTGPTASTINVPSANVSANRTVVVNASITDSGSNGALTKLGFGALTLGGQNSYTGSTVIGNGTLTLDFSQATAPADGTNILYHGVAAGALTLGGASAGLGNNNYAQLTVIGKSGTTTTQSFGSTTLQYGQSVIQANNNGGTANISLGNLTVNPGGTVLFIPPTSGTTTAFTTTASNDASGILGGWATIGNSVTGNLTPPGGFNLSVITIPMGNNYATVNGSGQIVPYIGYTDYQSRVTNTVTNVQDTGPIIPSGALHPNVSATTNLKFDANTVSADTTPIMVDANSSPGNGSTTNINTISFNSKSLSTLAIGVGNTLRLGQYGGIFKQDMNNANNAHLFIGGDGTVQSGNGVQTSLLSTQDEGILTAGPATGGPGQIVVTANNSSSESAGTLIFEAKITDNPAGGAVTFIKTGPNSMKLGGHNTYSGGTYLLEGRVQLTGTELTGSANPQQVADGRGTAGSAMTAANLSNPGGFGTGPVYIFPGAQVFPSGINAANAVIPNDFFFAGSGFAAENDGAFRLGSVNLTGKLTLIGDGMIAGAGTGILSGQITGNFNLTLGTSATINTSLVLANTQTTNAAAGTVSGLVSTNNWTGNTVISIGTGGTRTNLISLGANEQIPSGVGYGNLIINDSGTGSTTAGGTTTLNLNGYNQSVNGLASNFNTPGNIDSTTAIVIANDTSGTLGHSGNSLLTVGGNNQTASFAGIIRDGTAGTISVTKIGTGLQTLSGTNSYSGATNINNGALSISGSLNQSGVVNVNTSATGAGGIFGGNGTGTPSIIGVLTVQAATGSHKAIISPGPTGIGSTGIINAVSATIGAGTDLQFDLFSSANAGFNYDQLTSNGPVTINGATTLTTQPFGPGLYPIITGTSSGPTPAISGTLPTLVSGVTRLTVAYDASSWNPTTNASATSIVLNATGSIGNLTWTGAINGTWDIVGTKNWQANPIPSGSDPNQFYQADNVTFDDTGSNPAISLGTVVSPSSITVNANTMAYSFTGGGSIAGPGGLTKSGNATLTLGTSNTFVGPVTLNGGLLNISTNTALGLGNSFIINGGTLGNTSGSAVVLANNPAQTWGVDITFSPGNANSSLDLGTGAVVATETSGNPRVFNVASSTLTIGGKITENTAGTGVTKTGTGTLFLRSDSNFEGATTISAGTLRIGSSASLGGALVINAAPTGNTIVLPSTTGLTVGIGVSGAGIPVGTTITAIDTGTNTVTISNNATAANATDLTFATSTQPITVVSGATLDVGGGATANAIVIGPRPITISGTGVGNNGVLINSSGTAQQNALQNVTLAANASVGGSGRLDIRGGTPVLTLGNFTLTKVGSGQFSVVGGQITQGNIVINAGTFSIEAGANVINDGADSIQVGSGSTAATLQFFQNTGTVTRPITVTGTAVTINDASGANSTSTIDSNIALTGGNLTLNDANATANLVLTGQITQSGGTRTVTKTGPGIVTLANTNNTFGGTLSANGGLINFAALGSLGTGTTISFNGGGLQYAANMASPPDLSVRTLTFPGNGTIDTNGNNVTFANAIGSGSGQAGGLTKAGDGTLTLNGASGYLGTTVVNQGTLFLGAANSLPAPTVANPTAGGVSIGQGTLDINGISRTVSSLNSVGTNPTSGQIGSSTGTNVTLTYQGVAATTSTYSGQIVDGLNGNTAGKSTALTVSSGTLALAGSSSYSGPTTINSGATLQLGNGATSFPSLGSTALTNNGNLAFNTGGVSFSTPIPGSGKVTQLGGTTTFTTANSYTGGTVLQGGAAFHQLRRPSEQWCGGGHVQWRHARSERVYHKLAL